MSISLKSGVVNSRYAGKAGYLNLTQSCPPLRTRMTLGRSKDRGDGGEAIFL